jgi:hypothetical protein
MNEMKMKNASRSTKLLRNCFFPFLFIFVIVLTFYNGFFAPTIDRKHSSLRQENGDKESNSEISIEALSLQLSRVSKDANNVLLKFPDLQSKFFSIQNQIIKKNLF